MTKPAAGKHSSGRWHARLRAWAPVIGLTALAAALRFSALTDIPPGLYHDEAFNGLDALGILDGGHGIYFAANRGREPLFIYLIAVTVGALGRTPGALRLAAAICGTLTVPLTYLAARTWYDERIAFYSSAILATTYWHVQLSRVGFRAITLPLVIALAVWVVGRAIQTNRGRTWLLGGVLYGLAFYTYVAARFTPVALLGFAVYLIIIGEHRRLWPGAAYFIGGALATLLPLGAYTLTHWDVVMGRPGQVSVFNPLIHGGDVLGTLGRQLVSTLGMFFVRGDTIPRHNLPGRPVFDPLIGGAMIFGTGLAIVRARRRDLGSAMTLIWVGMMLAPTWLAEDAPHFLRAVGILPLLVVLPALGLDALRSWLQERRRHLWSWVAVTGVLLISLGVTTWDYFGRYPGRLDTHYAFEQAAATMSAEINTFLGSGWEGDGIAAPREAPTDDRRVYVDRRLWDEWSSIAFLIPTTERVTVFSPHDPPSPRGPAMLVIWPHDGIEAFARALPRNSRIEAYGGPQTQGDLEQTPYTAYVAYVIAPADPDLTRYTARFDEEMALVSYAITRSDRLWHLELEWMAWKPLEDDYTVSASLFDGGRSVAQDDAEPGYGYYPTRMWRPGDLVVSSHTLQPPGRELIDPSLMIGVYIWPTMEQLEGYDCDGTPLGQQISLPAAESPLR